MASSSLQKGRDNNPLKQPTIQEERPMYVQEKRMPEELVQVMEELKIVEPTTTNGGGGGGGNTTSPASTARGDHHATSKKVHRESNDKDNNRADKLCGPIELYDLSQIVVTKKKKNEAKAQQQPTTASTARPSMTTMLSTSSTTTTKMFQPSGTSTTILPASPTDRSIPSGLQSIYALAATLGSSASTTGAGGSSGSNSNGTHHQQVKTSTAMSFPVDNHQKMEDEHTSRLSPLRMALLVDSTTAGSTEQTSSGVKRPVPPLLQTTPTIKETKGTLEFGQSPGNQKRSSVPLLPTRSEPPPSPPARNVGGSNDVKLVLSGTPRSSTTSGVAATPPSRAEVGTNPRTQLRRSSLSTSTTSPSPEKDGVVAHPPLAEVNTTKATCPAIAQTPAPPKQLPTPPSKSKRHQRRVKAKPSPKTSLSHSSSASCSSTSVSPAPPSAGSSGGGGGADMFSLPTPSFRESGGLDDARTVVFEPEKRSTPTPSFEDRQVLLEHLEKSRDYADFDL